MPEPGQVDHRSGGENAACNGGYMSGQGFKSIPRLGNRMAGNDWGAIGRTLFWTVTITLASGCTGGGGSGDDGPFRATASQPVILPPPDAPLYGYDGSGMRAVQGQLVVEVDEARDEGFVDVELDAPEGRYSVHWTDFHEQPGQSWQEGGLVADVVEHGASGHGNKMEPQFDLHMGGWGSASLLLDGTPVVDPYSGGTTLNAHFMVTKEAMMEEGTRKVYKADRQTPFDPQTPGDGYVFPGRPEGHASFWGHGAYKDGIAIPTPPPIMDDHTDTATGATYTKSYPIPIQAVLATIQVDASIRGGGVGQLTLTLMDPSGTTVASGTLTAQQGASLSSPEGPLELGDWTLEVSGVGAQATYDAHVTTTLPTSFLLHVVYTSVTIDG